MYKFTEENNVEGAILSCREVIVTFDMLKDAVLNDKESVEKMFEELYKKLYQSHIETRKFANWLERRNANDIHEQK